MNKFDSHDNHAFQSIETMRRDGFIERVVQFETFPLESKSNSPLGLFPMIHTSVGTRRHEIATILPPDSPRARLHPGGYREGTFLVGFRQSDEDPVVPWLHEGIWPCRGIEPQEEIDGAIIQWCPTLDFNGNVRGWTEVHNANESEYCIDLVNRSLLETLLTHPQINRIVIGRDDPVEDVLRDNGYSRPEDFLLVWFDSDLRNCSHEPTTKKLQELNLDWCLMPDDRRKNGTQTTWQPEVPVDAVLLPTVMSGQPVGHGVWTNPSEIYGCQFEWTGRTHLHHFSLTLEYAVALRTTAPVVVIQKPFSERTSNDHRREAILPEDPREALRGQPVERPVELQP